MSDVLKTEISDLRQRPGFANDVADRIWRAWWEPYGFSFDAIRARVDESLNAEPSRAPLPLTLVAHSGLSFLGAASLIACDMAEREMYTPWVAAVWVEPAHRGAGLGSALAEAALANACALGYERAYLCAADAMAAFYHKQGWMTVETHVGRRKLAILYKITRKS